MSRKRKFKTKQKEFKEKKGSKTFLTDGNPKDGLNDPVWWMENPQIAKDAANLSYGNVAGTDIPFYTNDTKHAVPGIMKMEFIPIIGISKDGNSAVNNASRLLYSWIRHANSGSRNYEQSDLFTYVLAVSNMLTYHGELVRLYGLVQTYSKMNRYIGKALITSLGYDYDDVVKNSATLRYGINALAVRINSFAIPKQIHLFARHLSLVTSIFKDATDVKSQLYYFQPSQLFQWSAFGPDGVASSSLEPVMTPTYNAIGTVTVEQALTFGNQLVDSLAVNEDVGLMSGDILRGCGEGGIYHVGSIPETFVIQPVYDQVMLAQIHNANIARMPNANVSSEKTSLWVTQNNNNIIYNPNTKLRNSWAGEYASAFNQQVLDSGMENPDAVFNMEATRLKFTVDTTETATVFKDTGTEIISSCRIYTFANGTLIQEAAMETYLPGHIEATDALLQMVAKAPFDWAPIQYVAQGEAGYYMSIGGETFNYTFIDDLYLSKVHTAALLSVLNVYSLAMANK